MSNRGARILRTALDCRRYTEKIGGPPIADPLALEVALCYTFRFLVWGNSSDTVRRSSARQKPVVRLSPRDRRPSIVGRVVLNAPREMQPQARVPSVRSPFAARVYVVRLSVASSYMSVSCPVGGPFSVRVLSVGRLWGIGWGGELELWCAVSVAIVAH